MKKGRKWCTTDLHTCPEVSESSALQFISYLPAIICSAKSYASKYRSKFKGLSSYAFE
jgi:hypothetical protein